MRATKIEQRDNSFSIDFNRPSRFTLLFAGFGLALLVASWVHIIGISKSRTSVLNSETIDRTMEFVGDLAGGRMSSWTSANWSGIAQLTWDTIAMSVLASGMAGLGAILLMPLATRKSPRGLAGNVKFTIYQLTRFSFLFTRSVPELLWALIVIFVLSPGIFAGAVALAIHNFGVLGRLNADVAEDLDESSIIALESSGASTLQRYVSGTLPLIARQLLTFQFYRWEVVIRTTAVVGFVAASGIGYQLRLDLNFFRYPEVGQLLATYLVIVWAVDFLSVMVRRSFK